MAKLLRAVEVGKELVEPSLKRRRVELKSDFTQTKGEIQRSLVFGLCEDEHVVLLALHRLSEREAVQTLSTMFHEILLLHEGGGLVVRMRFSPDRYSHSFNRLQEKGLVEIRTPSGSSDLPRRYLPCGSFVNHLYTAFIIELGGGSIRDRSIQLGGNPLRRLPEMVQQWAVVQRRGL